MHLQKNDRKPYIHVGARLLVISEGPMVWQASIFLKWYVKYYHLMVLYSTRPLFKVAEIAHCCSWANSAQWPNEHNIHVAHW